MSCLEPLPTGWQFVTVEEIATGFRYGTSAKTSAENQGVPVLRMGNLTSRGEIKLDDLKYLPVGHPDLAETGLREGDLLFNRTNSFELVGKSAVYSGLPMPCSFASYLIRVRIGPRCSPKFLAFALNSHIGRSWIKTVVSQQVGQAKANVLFFDRKPASKTPWTKKLWIYDLRTNQHFTLKTNSLRREHLDDFVACYHPENRHKRKETERFKAFTYDELIKRDKLSLDVFWLKDNSLEDSASLPDPDVLAAEIVEDLQAALDEFALIAADLRVK